MIWILALISTAVAEDISIEPGAETSIQEAINDATPGDTITLSAGTYNEDLSTESHGTADAPITLRAAEDAEVIITNSGEVLQIDHSHWIIEGIVLDGQYGNDDTLEIRDGADHTRLNRVEVRHSGRDCIDMDGPEGVRILNSSIHHCLYFDEDNDERLDAHGITGGAVQDLRIENTDIHTFSGDGIQFDPGRAAPGWDNIHIEGCRFWLEPLLEDTAGFSAGQVPGENAIDTKTWNDADEASLTIVDTEAWGFKDGIDISNQAAFLFKENVEVSIQRVRVHKSEIAFRLRGPTSARPRGASVEMENVLVHDVGTALRYEDDLVNLSMSHVTFGAGIETMFEEADSEDTSIGIRNSLFLIDTLPEQVSGEDHNQAATEEDFVDAIAGDHHLIEGSDAIDAGSVISGIGTDLDGNDRITGPAPDLGAYEYGELVQADTGSTDTGSEDDPATGSDDGAAAEEDSASPDAEHDGPSGIGAAEQVGEKGGCGCHTSRNRANATFWGLLIAATMLRRRWKSSTAQTSA